MRNLIASLVMALALVVAAPANAAEGVVTGHVQWSNGTPCKYCDIVVRDQSGNQRAAFYRVTDATGGFWLGFVLSNAHVFWGIFARYNTGTCKYFSQTVWRWFDFTPVRTGTLVLQPGCFKV